MITQTKIGLNSRSEANPFNEDGFLPLITAPMYSVVDESNYQLFLDNKVQVCLPRGSSLRYNSTDYFSSVSLEDFIRYFIEGEEDIIPDEKYKICIDTANGNMPQLHETIRKAKSLHGNNLIIMAGNVGSVEAFVELAKTGCDYIRVGIGGGGGCNTTSNTGVGQYDLHDLITFCKYPIEDAIKTLKQIKEEGKSEFYQRHGFGSSVGTSLIETHYNDTVIMSKVKIVADGISSYINYCQKEYNFNDNGYAAINKLLHAGADLVMVGKLFAQCVESAGEKGIQQMHGVESFEHWQESRKNLFGLPDLSTPSKYFKVTNKYLMVKYSGMSTQQEQKKYKPELCDVNLLSPPKQLFDGSWEYEVETVGDSYQVIKPSEGSVQWIPVRWTLNEWLNGSDKQDESPYLMGFVNALKSMMAYTNRTKL